jgi:hypothetical protein
MTAPTQQDAQLMIQLMQWGTSMGLQKHMATLLDPSFDPETASPFEPAVTTVLSFGEALSTLVKKDLLSDELVHDWLWVRGMWGKVAPAALRAREATGEARLYENFEALAKSAPGTDPA